MSDAIRADLADLHRLVCEARNHINPERYAMADSYGHKRVHAARRIACETAAHDLMRAMRLLERVRLAAGESQADIYSSLMGPMRGADA